MKQYQRHIEIATKLVNAGNYDLAINNIEALIRSARSNKAKAYLILQCWGINEIAESQGYDLS